MSRAIIFDVSYTYAFFTDRHEIVGISAGLAHNCALTSAGHLYTWGLGADQLGHGPDKNHLSSPQLVESLLPENGGGRVTSVCASGTHTCVVTDTGDTYSWGSSIDMGCLGHGPYIRL